jgi:hypothetical protein
LGMLEAPDGVEGDFAAAADVAAGAVDFGAPPVVVAAVAAVVAGGLAGAVAAGNCGLHAAVKRVITIDAVTRTLFKPETITTSSPRQGALSLRIAPVRPLKGLNIFRIFRNCQCRRVYRKLGGIGRKRGSGAAGSERGV